MTTVIADRITQIVGLQPVKVTRAVHNDPNDPSKQIKFDISAIPTGIFMELDGPGSGICNIPDKSFTAIDPSNASFTAPQTCGNVSGIASTPQLLTTSSSNLIIEPISPSLLTNNTSVYKLQNSGNVGSSNIVFNNISGSASTLNFKFTTPLSTAITLFLPDSSTTLPAKNTANTFTALQKFANNFLTHNISASSTNGNLTLTPNGTGKIIINGSEKVDTLKAITNTNLTLSGNGTGSVLIGSTGLKFANEALTNYDVNTFGVTFSVGAFSIPITVKYQLSGKTVTLRFPAATGTPATDGIWTSTTIPVALRPITTQFLSAGIGLRAGVRRLLLIKVNTTGALVASLTDGTIGFGNSGTCGWANGWDVTYRLD